jgi:hypothetical protein
VFGIVYYGGGIPRPRRDRIASLSPIRLLAAVKGFA